jgi:hypothetical protein
VIKVNDYTVYGLHSIERTMQYIKDRTESFDDYFPCRKKNCKLLHVWNRLNLFIGYHNKQLQIVKWTEPQGLWKETTLGYFRFDSAAGRKTNLLATKTIDRSPVLYLQILSYVYLFSVSSTTQLCFELSIVRIVCPLQSMYPQ